MIEKPIYEMGDRNIHYMRRQLPLLTRIWLYHKCVRILLQGLLDILYPAETMTGRQVVRYAYLVLIVPIVKSITQPRQIDALVYGVLAHQRMRKAWELKA